MRELALNARLLDETPGNASGPTRTATVRGSISPRRPGYAGRPGTARHQLGVPRLPHPHAGGSEMLQSLIDLPCPGDGRHQVAVDPFAEVSFLGLVPPLQEVMVCAAVDANLRWTGNSGRELFDPFQAMPLPYRSTQELPRVLPPPFWGKLCNLLLSIALLQRRQCPDGHLGACRHWLGICRRQPASDLAICERIATLPPQDDCRGGSRKAWFEIDRPVGVSKNEKTMVGLTISGICE